MSQVLVSPMPSHEGKLGAAAACNHQRAPSLQQTSTTPTLSFSTELELLLQHGNPSWSGNALKAAKSKLDVIGIRSYSDLEQVLLQGKGVLNNRLRDHGLKAFAPSTLGRLLSAVNSEQDRRRQAANQAKLKGNLPVNDPPVATKSQPLTSNPEGVVSQTDLYTEQFHVTLQSFLKTAKPCWSTTALEAITKKLRVIGIVTYSDFEEVLSQPQGILNKRLRNNGLKAFAPSTLECLSSAVQSQQEWRRQTTNFKKHQMWTSVSCDQDGKVNTEDYRLYSSDEEDANSDGMDDGMQWYDDSDKDHWSQDISTHQDIIKVQIPRLDLSRVMNLKNCREAPDTNRSDSTAVGTSYPASPLSSHRSVTWGETSVIHYSVVTP